MNTKIDKSKVLAGLRDDLRLSRIARETRKRLAKSHEFIDADLARLNGTISDCIARGKKRIETYRKAESKWDLT